MKLLLLLLVFHLSFADTNWVCGPGFAANDIKNVSPIRTDWCNPKTRKSELFECHLQNKTIRGNIDIEEFRDGKKYITRCVEDGEKGIHVTSKAVLSDDQEKATVLPTTEFEMFCENGRKIGEEWVVGSLVRACVQEDERRVHDKVVGCISHFGNFMEIGENYTESIGMDVYNSHCIAVGAGAVFKDVFVNDFYPPGTVRPDRYARREVPRCAGDENEPVRSGQRFDEGDFEYNCEIDYRGRKTVTLTACLIPGTLFEKVLVGETIPRNGSLYSCEPTSDGKARLKITAASDELTTTTTAPEPTTRFVDCNHEDVGNEWVDGQYVIACKYIDAPNGRKFRFRVAVRCIIDGEEIPVGEDKRYPDGSVLRCVRRGIAEASVQELPGGTTNMLCKMGRKEEPKKLGEEWEEPAIGGGFVKTCVHDNKNDAVVAIKACIHPKTGEHILVNEVKRDPLQKDGGNIGCFRADFGEKNQPVLSAKLLETNHPVRAVPSTTNKPSTADLSDVPCENGKSFGEEWIEGDYVIACKITMDRVGRKIGTKVAVRCITSEGEQLPKGKKKLLSDGGVLACVRKGETEAVLTAMSEEIANVVCKNGKAIGDDWEVHSSSKKGHVMTCSLDSKGLKALIVVKACIHDRVIIPIGESKDVPEGRCTCVGGQLEGSSVLAAGVHCLSNPPFVVQSPTPTIAPEPTTTGIPGEPSRENKDLCESGKMELDVERVDGNYVMACKNMTYKILKREFASLEYRTLRCISSLGDEIPLGQKKIRGGGVFECTLFGLRVKPLDLNSTCANGQQVATSRIENDVERICNGDLLVEARFCIYTYKNVSGYIPVGLWYTHHSIDWYYICEKRGELDAALLKKSPREICRDGDATFESKAPRSQIPPWAQDGFVEGCVQLDNGEYQVASVGCITPEGDGVRVGDTKSYESGKSYTCSKLNDFGAVLNHHQKIPQLDPLLCANGLRMNNFTTEGYIIRMVNKNCVKQAVHCYVKHIVRKYIEIGETIREDAVQYSCQKRGEIDAEMVIKPFSQLCEEGDNTVNAWISESVLRDCDRHSDKPAVHARMCVLNDKRIIEIGQSIKEEFETYSCKRVGKFDAVLDVDMSRIHPAYFTTPGICKNGKKIGEEWTEKGYARRACHDHKGKAVVVEIGCVLADGRVLPVGSQEKKKDTNAPADRLVIRTFKCEAMTPYGISLESVVADESRVCENGKREGEEWEHENVVRTCKELDDKMQIVALHCVFGNNEKLEIGQLRETSEVSSIECVRVGDHDAATVIDLLSTEGMVCENGRKLNEEWDDGDIRRSCRLRNRRPTAFALGCIMFNGLLLIPHDEWVDENTKPGYAHSRVFTQCVKVDEFDLRKVVTNEEEMAGDCGGKELGDVWATDRFIKKCKIVESDVDKDGNPVHPHGEHAVVTIGCISRKGTHVLEGQAIEEDDLHITCHRNEDGRMAIRYSFTIKEQ